MTRDLVRHIIIACTRAEAEWARELGECGRIVWEGIGWVCHQDHGHDGGCRELTAEPAGPAASIRSRSNP